MTRHNIVNWLLRGSKTPWTLLLLVLSVIGFAVMNLDSDYVLVRWLTFQDLIIGEEYIGFRSLGYTLNHKQWWRLVTPIFLHFDIFHILFNGLWFWEFGRRIEHLIGRSKFLLLVLCAAIFSNSAQYVFQKASLFGGMSGVIYAFLGYIWIRHRLSPHPMLAIPPGIIGFMLIWLVICMTGVVGLLANVQIANGAHLGGLIFGVLMGALAGFTSSARTR